MATRRWIAGLCLALVSVSPTVAQSLTREKRAERRNGWIVVLDLTKTAEKTANRIFSFPADKKGLLDELQKACQLPSNDSTKNPKKNPTEVLRNVRSEVKDTRSRWVSKKGGLLHAFVFYDENASVPVVTMNEAERETRLSEDLATLIKIIKELGVMVKEERAAGEEITCQQIPYRLTKTRSNLAIKACQDGQGTGSPPQSAPPTGCDGNGAPVPTVVETSLITGPREHWFLSADIAANSVSEFKYDSASGSVEPREKPSRVLVGFNYMMGDLLSDDRTWRDWWQGFTLKLLLEASSRPTDSLGFAVGLRLPSIRRYGFALDAFSPFVGRIRTRNDLVEPGGNVREDARSAYETIFGISLNLDRALDWVKKPAKKDK